MLFDVSWQIKEKFFEGWIKDIRNPFPADTLEELINGLAQEDLSMIESVKIIARR